ncbi:hypothetical protein [Streptomyces sp. NPDC092129]|uniref:hypothetical protein n=1 Tax=Streptomyces sp. NPDC092129 TaxID=3366010 RepID=UPI0037F5DDA6
MASEKFGMHLHRGVLIVHPVRMVIDRRHREELQARDQENRRRLQALFNDPDHAARVLGEATARDDTPGSISSIVLDHATVDHALRYFSGARWEDPRIRLPTRPRLTLQAVAEYVNAAILYENVLTGPEGWATTYGDPLLRTAKELTQDASKRLSSEEVFAVLALAKATALETAGPQGMIDSLRTLLGVPLREEQVLEHLRAIDPELAHVSPHHLVELVNDEEYYRGESMTGTLLRSQSALGAIDETDGDGFWSEMDYYWTVGSVSRSAHPELFAAHLIYRTRVYVLLADLLGCPYGADALRTGLARPRPRHAFAERVAALVDDAERDRDKQINELLTYEAFEVRIPLVLKHVLSRAGKPSEVLPITLEIRDSRPARRYREYCSRVDAAIAEGNRDDVARACAELSSYGVRFEGELVGRHPTMESAVQTAKDLVSIGSPLLGALIPGLTFAAGQVGNWRRRRRFAFLEKLTSTPRNLNAVEHEFAHLWPRL